jgi:DNA processing protein
MNVNRREESSILLWGLLSGSERRAGGQNGPAPTTGHGVGSAGWTFRFRADSMSFPSAEIADWLRLSFEPGVGPVLAGQLLAAFGSPGALYATPYDTLAAYMPATLAARIAAPPAAEMADSIAHALAWAEKPGHHLLTLADDAYPAMLRETPDPPVLLYVLGALAALSLPTIAIVGARHATPGGSQMAEDFACALATRGWSIASGLALGIDAAAHGGALAAPDGTTVAVIGTGADLVYPARNRDLAHRIALGGAVVSELPLGTPAAPHHFPRRNRLVAGLSHGVLVVEAAVHSGSLITARLAADIGREVFAIPGSIHSPLSRGCHALIRQGAKLVETAQDVLDELALQVQAAPAPDHDAAQRMLAGFAAMEPDGLARRNPANGVGADRLEPEDDRLLALLGFDPLTVDDVQQRSGLATDVLQGRLLALELAGRIARLPGARIQQLLR